MANILDVKLPGAAGTIDAMEWLRDNEWPTEIEFVFFYDKYGSLMFTCTKEVELPHVLQESIDEAKNIDGMLRLGNPMRGWYLKIAEQWYFLYH